MLPATIRSRRFVLVGIVVSVAVLLGSAAIVQVRADSASRTMAAKVAELEAAWNGRSFARPVAWGEATDGEAFLHYERAATLAHDLLQQDNDAMVAAIRLTDAQLAAETGLHTRWRPVVDALRAGAHSSRAKPPAWSTSMARASTSNLLNCRWVANAAVFAASAARHDGRDVESVRHTLDAALFGADIARHGTLVQQMIGVAILAIGASEPWAEPALAQLDDEALTLLADGLRRIDEGLPAWLDQSAEVLFLATALRTVPDDPDFVPQASSWRYAFSGRWVLADAFLGAAANAAEVARTRDLPWPQRASLLAQEHAALQASPNPVTATFVPQLETAERGLREAIARLRLLRMAIDRHRGLDVPPLRDPLGDGPICVTKTAEGVRLHCAGAEDRPGLARVVAR